MTAVTRVVLSARKIFLAAGGGPAGMRGTERCRREKRSLKAPGGMPDRISSPGPMRLSRAPLRASGNADSENPIRPPSSS